MKFPNHIASGLKELLRSSKLRLWILITTLILFILAAGAPGATGGIGN